MKPETLKAAIAEAKRFIKAAEQCKFVPGCYRKDILFPESTKSTAATKRASMDLTRMLADLRLGR